MESSNWSRFRIVEVRSIFIHILFCSLLLTSSSISGMSLSSGKIVVVGLNPALQKRLVLNDAEKLVTGNVHRIKTVTEGIGGKGQDVAIALNILKVKCELAQFVGGVGAEGDKLMRLLDQKLTMNKGFEGNLTIRTKGILRTCTTIVANDAATELVEPNGYVEMDEINTLSENIKNMAKTVTALCIMGSMPPGCPENTYANLIRDVLQANKDTLCLIDSVVGLEPMIATLADLKACDRTALKINLSEFQKLSEESSSNNSDRSVEVSQALDSFARKYGGFPLLSRALGYILLTDGAKSSYFVELCPDCKSGRKFSVHQLKSIDLSDITEGPLYPIGAGDTVAAGTLAAWTYFTSHKDDTCPLLDEKVISSIQHNKKTDDLLLCSFRFGLACGSASCLKEENSEFEIDDALNLFESLN